MLIEHVSRFHSQAQEMLVEHVAMFHSQVTKGHRVHLKYEQIMFLKHLSMFH